MLGLGACSGLHRRHLCTCSCDSPQSTELPSLCVPYLGKRAFLELERPDFVAAFHDPRPSCSLPASQPITSRAPFAYPAVPPTACHPGCSALGQQYAAMTDIHSYIRLVLSRQSTRTLLHYLPSRQLSQLRKWLQLVTGFNAPRPGAI